MGRRRYARELALQALFYVDSSRLDAKEALLAFAAHFNPPKKAKAFFEEIAYGVVEHQDVIDELISRFSSNWKLSRMSSVDRNAMRIAVYEFLYCDDIPERVSINEAIDIGKKFGTGDTGAFINGILDSIHLHLKDKK